MNLLQRLRIETADAHERIERDLDLVSRTRSLPVYRDLLVRFYGFHSAWEPCVEAAICEPDFFEGRRKVVLLIQDLQALGMSIHEIDEIPSCDLVVPMNTSAEALGSMYVMDGSTLGGALIARHIGGTLGLDRDSGCSYFQCYGDRVRPMWKSFGAMLIACSTAETEDAIVASARETFEVLHARSVPRSSSIKGQP